MPDSPLLLIEVLAEECRYQGFQNPFTQEEIDHKRSDYEKQFADIEDDDDRHEMINAKLVAEFYQWLQAPGPRAPGLQATGLQATGASAPGSPAPGLQVPTGDQGKAIKRSAICFSGGGIRSATFGLGLAQGLAQHLNLGQFNFLSTVSGGGYLGSWLTAWIHRRGMDEVQRSLGRKSVPPNSFDRTPLQPEPEPVRHLRSYSNYLSPRLGLLSADSWSLVAIFTRNLLLNWMMLIPLLLIPLAIPRLAMSIATWDNPKIFFVPGALVLSLLAGIISVAYIVANRPSLRGYVSILNKDELRPPTDEQSFLKWGLAPLLISAIASSTYWAWSGGRGGGFDIFFTGRSATNTGATETSGATTAAPNFARYWVMAIALGIVLHLLAASFAWFFTRRPFELARNVLAGAASGLAILLMVKYLPAAPYLVAEDTLNYLSSTPFVLFGITFHYLGVLIAQPWLERLHIRDYLYAIFTGGVGGLFLWFIVRHLFPNPVVDQNSAAFFVCFAAPAFLLAFLTAATIFTGLASGITSDADREWMARAGAWIMITITVWAGLSSLVVFGPKLLFSLWTSVKISLFSLSTLAGIITLLGGMSSKSKATKGEAGKSSKFDSIIRLAPTVAAPLFAVSILLALALGSSWLIYKAAPSTFGSWAARGLGSAWHMQILYVAPIKLVSAFIAAAAAVAAVVGLGVNINKFSLHSAYRDRLIRAYLGASRSSAERQANPFTGLDEKDNLQMNELQTDLFYADRFSIQQMNKFIARLVKDPAPSSTAISNLIWKKLPWKTLMAYWNVIKDGGEPSEIIKQQTQRCLIDGLNRIIQRERLQDEVCFQRDECDEPKLFDERVVALIARQPVMTSANLNWRPIKWILPRQLKERWEMRQRLVIEQVRLNRLLLEITFPDELPKMDESEEKPRPLHVLNMALNLVSGKELAWQNRKAESFTASPLHAGNSALGYRRAKDYAITRQQRQAFTLGTALAISGAAASPNMGYHSSPIVTFLLAFFNVRLGWWLGNPGTAGEHTYMKPGPTFAPNSLAAETFGLTDNTHPYVYVSDGGHFENLGLYEMVLRRCSLIVVSDSSEDADFNFESLGNALSKIRADLGVPISFNSIPISQRQADTPTYSKTDKDTPGKKYCAIGAIHYSAVDGGNAADVDGVLIYIKPTFYGTEPADVYNYAKANPLFPHESTGDQMYSESQFESYRALGEYIACRIVGDHQIADAQGLIKYVRRYLGDDQKKATGEVIIPGLTQGLG